MSCSKYRPISVLPLFSKLLEQLIQKKLKSYLKKFNFLYKHRFGLPEDKSTEQHNASNIKETLCLFYISRFC